MTERNDTQAAPVPVLRLGTRQSALALAQSEQIVKLMNEHHEGQVAVELVPIETRGDRDLDVPLHLVSDPQFFSHEIEAALLRREIDFAVHSLKDLPIEQPQGIVLVSYPRREQPEDVLVSRTGQTLAQLPPGARVGTSSLRRRALLQRLRPDVACVPVRGPVDKRLQQLDAGDYDALVLAAAGLHRLGLADRITEVLDPAEFLPAPGQGALVFQARANDEAVHGWLRPLQHGASALTVMAERACLEALGGGNELPVGALCRMVGKRLHLHAMVVSPDGREAIQAAAERPAGEPVALGQQVAYELLAKGAARLLRTLDVGDD